MLLPDSAQRALVRWDPPDGEEFHRCCYVTLQVGVFLRSSEGKVRDRSHRLSARQQLATKLNGFVAGRSLPVLGAMDTDPAFRKLVPDAPEGPCVWELRTLDVRLFGWFPGTPNTWIGVKAILKRDLVLSDGTADADAYAAQIAEVVAWRRQHHMEQQVWRLGKDDLLNFLKR